MRLSCSSTSEPGNNGRPAFAISAKMQPADLQKVVEKEQFCMYSSCMNQNTSWKEERRRKRGRRRACIPHVDGPGVELGAPEHVRRPVPERNHLRGDSCSAREGMACIKQSTVHSYILISDILVETSTRILYEYLCHASRMMHGNSDEWWV